MRLIKLYSHTCSSTLFRFIVIDINASSSLLFLLLLAQQLLSVLVSTHIASMTGMVENTVLKLPAGLVGPYWSICDYITVTCIQCFAEQLVDSLTGEWISTQLRFSNNLWVSTFQLLLRRGVHAHGTSAAWWFMKWDSVLQPVILTYNNVHEAHWRRNYNRIICWCFF